MEINELAYLKVVADFYNYPLSVAQFAHFAAYQELLLRVNQSHNLISKPDEGDLVCRHFADSLLLFGIPGLTFAPGSRFLDVGSGAGFPGIPLKILLPESNFVLLDAQRKRTAFLKKVVRDLNLGAVEVENARLESLDVQQRRRQSFDFIVSRAVENFETILKKSLPLLDMRGILIFYKGAQQSAELGRVCGLIDPDQYTYQLVSPQTPPGFPYQRQMVLIHHVSSNK